MKGTLLRHDPGSDRDSIEQTYSEILDCENSVTSLLNCLSF